MRRRFLVLVSALTFVLPLITLRNAGVAFAQETTGTIAGRIVDAQGLAVPGVTVTITGQQGVKTVVADNEGRFSVPFLTPGRYTVHAELQGFKAFDQQNIVLGVGQTVDLPVRLEVGNFSETVQVTVSADVVNPITTTAGASLSSDLLERVPVGRNLGSTLYLAPGVSSSNTAGAANPSISGGSGLDNHYVIDGVNVTNQGYGALGSYSIIFGSLGNATPYDFIQEVQVKTGGYEAEFGQSIGGVVNVITKAGSNNVRGSVFGYVRPQGLESDFTHFQSINGSVQTQSTQTADAGGEIGFPIVKDRLFFFGAVDPARDRAVLRAPTGFSLESLGDVDRDRQTYSYSAKTTWQVNGNNRIDASFFGDPSNGDNGPQRLSALLVDDTSSFSSLIYGGHNQTVRYNGAINDRWLLEGAYARALNRIEETPSVNTWRVTDETVTPRAISGGIGFYEAGNRSVNDQWSIKSTNIFGDHQIRYGYEFDKVNYSQLNQRTGPTFVAPDGRTTATGAQVSVLSDVNFGKIYRVTRANFNSGRTTDQRYHQAFVQDTWRIGNNLTVNPGLRYEQETLVGSIIDNFTLKNNWAPRIGATYAVDNGRGKLYGSYGRYYSRIPNDLAARALSADDSTSRADYFDANLTQPIPNGVATIDPDTGASITNHFVLASTGADTIDPNAKMSYADEYQAGYEHEVMPHTSLGVRYSYRTIGRVLEDVANAPMAAYDLEVPGLSSVEYILTNPSSSTAIFAPAAFLGAKFDDPVHKYHAVEVTLNRRFANNWAALASYRWSRLRGNFEGFYRDDNGQSDPGITSLYDFPTNDPSYTAIGGEQFGYGGDIRFLGDPNGILPLDRPHQIKLSGNYLFPIGLNIGAVVNFTSGAPLTPFAANPNYDTGGEIPAGARGSGIQTIDGFKTRTPFQREVSAQASYDIPFGGSRSLTLLADVFNVFNSQSVVTYDQWTELSFQVPNPDFGTPITHVLAGAPPQFQTPRQVRLGARLSF
ncbi:MAG TPA: TonB-dependent receptor [Vicinamibacterales bacterium]|nr:TonB-dependent receptor [Vicinamibacterales bacterium]